MKTLEIHTALAEGKITADQAVQALVDLGADPQDARFRIDLQTGKVKGDVIGLDQATGRIDGSNDLSRRLRRLRRKRKAPRRCRRETLH